MSTTEFNSKNRWIKYLCIISVSVLLICIVTIFYCFRKLDAQSDQIVEVLSAQNGLVADYHCEISMIDLDNNTVSFFLSAIPKTYRDGMSALFVADSGIGITTLRGDLTHNNKFTCEILSELTDSIVISVVFITGDLEQTEVLARYDNLYSDSIPEPEHNSIEQESVN